MPLMKSPGTITDSVNSDSVNHGIYQDATSFNFPEFELSDFALQQSTDYAQCLWSGGAYQPDLNDPWNPAYTNTNDNPEHRDEQIYSNNALALPASAAQEQPATPVSTQLPLQPRPSAGGHQLSSGSSTGSTCSSISSTSITPDQTATEDCPGQLPKRPARPRKTPHKLIEQRYRHSINDHLNSLSAKLPGLDDFSTITIDRNRYSCHAKGPSKAFVIETATNYIETLERKQKESCELITALQGQVKSLQQVPCPNCSILQCYLRECQVPTYPQSNVYCGTELF